MAAYPCTLDVVAELSREFEGAWQQFQASSSVRLLQETLEWEWTRGRAAYAAFLIEAGVPELRTHIASVIERISGIPGVEPYPQAYWHSTVKGVGFVVDDPGRPDEISPAEVQRIAEEARPLLEKAAPFAATVGRVNAFAEVVYLEVLDGGVIRSLNSRLLDRVGGLQRQPVDGEHFLPHISIARFSSAEGLPRLKETLAVMRTETAAGPTFEVREALLIRALLGAEAPAFETLAAYPLRG